MTTMYAVQSFPAINRDTRYSGPHGQVVEIVEDNPIQDFVRVEDVNRKQIITIHSRELFLKIHTPLPDSSVLALT